MSRLRLLFASVHGYPDPTSGAALATRDLFELLAARGHDCRALTLTVLDHERDQTVESSLRALGVPVGRQRVETGIGNSTVEVFDLALGGVRVTLMPTESSRLERAPSLDEARAFLGLFDQALGRFRPDVLLTYGGHPVSRELMRRARLRGVPVVFHLHNFAYDKEFIFEDVNCVIVPSEYARRYYSRRLGLDCTVLPYPLRAGRVVADQTEPRYATFVNPQPAKGATVFARIALELQGRRPDIPLLVVEGRGQVDGLARTGLDLSGLTNLHRMANTSDPRDFYRVSRAMLVPSLWRESFGRVAAEGLANGLPVLASDRGALPETLGDAGFLFTVPARCGPDGAAAPTAREVAPWVATIERLWDDPAWESAHRNRARAEAPRWNEESLVDRYQTCFESLVKRSNR